jgi:hypothetical protein
MNEDKEIRDLVKRLVTQAEETNKHLAALVLLMDKMDRRSSSQKG